MNQNCSPCEALRSVTGGVIRPGGVALTRTAIDFCNLDVGASLLDVGCGSGESVEMLINEYCLDASGVDSSEAMLAEAKKRCADLPVQYGEAAALDFADSSLSAVLSECTFSHFEQPDEVLKEFSRVLIPHGWLILSDIYVRRGRDLKQDLKELLADLAASGFAPALLQDHSDGLRKLSIQLIWKYGSVEEFQALNCRNCNQCSLGKINEEEKLGYYLLIAQKN